MELFVPVITTCIISVMFLIYLNVYYDVSCQRLFEKEDTQSLENIDEEDDGNYNLEII